MSKIQVLCIDHTSRLGGGEIALAILLAKINRDIVHPSVILFEDGPLRQRLEEHVDVTICPLNAAVLATHRDSVGFGVLSRFRDVWSTLMFLGRLRRVIGEANVDLVHTNSFKAHILGGIAARLSGVPVIWHVRDRIANDYLPGWVARIFRAMARIIPAYVIANSAATLSTLYSEPEGHKDQGSREAHFRSRSCAIHDGVLEVPMLTDHEPREFTVVGLVGRISAWKGQDVFLKAAARVCEAFPNTIFRIIGSPLFGEDAYGEELHRLCSELNLTSSVEFTGFISDVAGAIDELDVLVHASTLPEPFGQVIIEGMAAAKPIVATNGGGVPEIVLDQVTGFLVPMGDVQKMADAILRLVEDPSLRRRMGASGRKRVEDEFRVEKTAEKVEQVYATVLANSSYKVKVASVRPQSAVANRG